SPAAGSSANFPTTSGAEQSTAGGATDAFVVKYTQGTSQTFSLSATALSPSSVTPGQTSTSTVTVTPAGGFSGTVTFACTVSPVVTLGPTCSGSGSPASPGTLTVSTTPATGSLSMPGRGNSRGIFYAMMLPFAGLSLVGIGFRAGPRRRKLFGILLIGMIMVSFTLMPACGGSSHSSGGSSGTPAGTYTVTVTGTATGATQTGTSPGLTLTVN
ncbi:MAG TPA: hypothetical protein VND65_15670, partial [Candidatus Binatia bacterium]|nr:hypothetical protein [Candidatus Binatia bacterium]